MGAAQPLRLWGHGRAPVGGVGAEPARSSEQRQLLGHLERELAGRDENERRRSMLAHREALDERQPEGERLAGARRGLAEHVAAGDGIGNDERLDAEGLDDAAGAERVLDLRADAERRQSFGTYVVRLLFGFEKQELESGRNENLNLTGRPSAVRGMHGSSAGVRDRRTQGNAARYMPREW